MHQIFTSLTLFYFLARVNQYVVYVNLPATVESLARLVQTHIDTLLIRSEYFIFPLNINNELF